MDKRAIRVLHAPRRAAALFPLLLTTASLLFAACGSSPSAAIRRAAPTPTVFPPVVYAAIGASDAVGVGATHPNTEGYVPRLIAHLPAHSRALNVGISGALVQDALTRELPKVIALQPTLVTVWLVGNDFRNCTPLTQYAASLNTLLDQLQSQTHADVFVANTPDMSELPYFKQGAPESPCLQGESPAQIRALSRQWNDVINPLVARHGATLVDLYSSNLEGHPEYVAADGFHPSSAGYEVLADIFWLAITAHHAIPTA
ncbi:MAG TPA: GDSL-type esterase/lipase family protein [Ktedonobacterales bacterium]|nr:GDSL-type esterase/lipase family protein [Ktedonobacterales bacterium]